MYAAYWVVEETPDAMEAPECCEELDGVGEEARRGESQRVRARLGQGRAKVWLVGSCIAEVVAAAAAAAAGTAEVRAEATAAEMTALAAAEAAH